MNIITSQYSLFNNTLEIYVAGCNGHCDGCHSPETWDYNQGIDYREYIPKLKSKLLEYPDMIDSVWILGGEPLDQNIFHLKELLEFINTFNVEVWLFTSYDLENITEFILEELDYIKTGRYDNSKLGINVQYDVTLATTNQKITKLR